MPRLASFASKILTAIIKTLPPPINVLPIELQNTIINPNYYDLSSTQDWFSYSVSVSSLYTIVGAYGEDDPGGSNSGVAYVFLNSTGELVTTLYNPNAYGTSASDNFGQSVGISDSYAIVGASYEDDASGTQSGKAYIFSTADWSLLYTLDNPNAYGTSASDYFGQSVGITESYAIVGAWREDDAGGTDSGKAYIYSTADGSLLYTLDNPNAYNTSTSDYFGLSVGITESYAIVGAYGEDDAGGAQSGKAYIFSTADGSLLYTLDNPNAYNTSTSDNFGYSVGISESYAIVGAYGEDDAGGTTSGKAYIFSTADGSLLYTLDNPNAYNTSAGDYFGFSVGISESYAIVGAYREDDASGTDSGKAYIYSTADGSLLYTLDNPNAYGTSASDYFGRVTAITNNYASVGASYEDDASGTDSGKAYIFSTADGSLLHTLDNPNVYDFDQDYFGNKVATCKSYTIAGAYRENGVSGVAYIFSNITGKLLHTLDNPNPYGTTVNDYFGSAVSISESYAIVGANYEDDASGTSSGKAYIYSTADGSLLYTLDNPNAYGTSADDYFGFSVGITESYAIVSAWQEDDAGGSGSGKAYIYSTADGSLLYTLDDPNAYGTSTLDLFGSSVAISESYAIVGARNESDASGAGSGKAYIYSTADGSLLYTLDNPNPYGTSDYDYFGFSVGITESYAIVSAAQEDDAGGNYSGKAYIYSTADGSLLYTLDNPTPYGTSENDYFGFSVGISESYAIVSATGEDDASGTTSGKAYIYSTADGSLLYTLDNPNAYGTSAGDQFGSSVAISDLYAVSSAYLENTANGFAEGATYIYRLPDYPVTTVSTATLLFSIDNPNPAGVFPDNDHFGESVVAGRTWVAVGAPYDDSGGAGGSGTVYIYNRFTGNLIKTIYNPDVLGGGTYYDRFGNVMTKTPDGKILFISATGDETFGQDANINYGIVYAYDTGDWSLKYYITSGNNDSQGFFARHMSADNYHIALPEASQNFVRIFEVNSGTQVAYIKNPNIYTGSSTADLFGYQLYLSSSTLIVSAPQEEATTSTNSWDQNLGGFYVFDWQTSTSTYVNYVPEPKGPFASNEYFGTWMTAGSGNLYVYGGNGTELYAYDLASVSTPSVQPTTVTSFSYSFGLDIPLEYPWTVVGDTLLASNFNFSSNSGRVIGYDANTLAQKFVIENPNTRADTTASDYFGYSLSVDGNLLAVSAKENVNVSSSGTLYLFRLD